MKRRNISENFKVNNMTIYLESLKNVNVDKEKINYLKSFIQLNYLRKIDKSSLVLIEEKKCWIITIDVFLLNFSK
jgi:exosome complex RNA-binding protein Rrp42 (RNase PH superfamily)